MREHVIKCCKKREIFCIFNRLLVRIAASNNFSGHQRTISRELNSTSQATLNPEFHLELRTQSLNLIQISLYCLALFALVAFFAAHFVSHEAQLEITIRDPRQWIRLSLFVLCLACAFLNKRSRGYFILHYQNWVSFIWLSLNIFLGLLVLANYQLTELGLAGGQSHGRFGGAIIIVTLVAYVTSFIGFVRMTLVLAFPTVSNLIFNFRFLEIVENGSHILYLMIAHILGISVNKFWRDREANLFINKKKLQEALNAVQMGEIRERQISAAKTRLIASVSHDLRQPLNSLALYNNLLKSRFGGEQNVALNSVADRVQECLAAMDGNLTRLQDIAHLQAQTVTLNLSPTSLRDSLGTIQTVFQPIAVAANVHLVVRVDSGTDIFLLTHAERLFEILANLLSNAIKFSTAHVHREAWVLVRARKLTKMGQNKFVEIIIRDNGLGIASANHDRIFDEYFQLNNPERQSSKGYGLGLSIVRELTNSMPDHALELESRLGHGASFKLSIPIASQDQFHTQIIKNDEDSSVAGSVSTALSIRPQLSRPLSGANILLVEDDTTLRAALTAQLQELGANVRSYASAKHALAATANDVESPTCIISDYWLPAPVDGLLAIRMLREQFEELVPALLISASTDIDPKRLGSLPHLDFALKPVSANTLLSYVDKHRTCLKNAPWGNP